MSRMRTSLQGVKIMAIPGSPKNVGLCGSTIHRSNTAGAHLVAVLIRLVPSPSVPSVVNPTPHGEVGDLSERLELPANFPALEHSGALLGMWQAAIDR